MRVLGFLFCLFSIFLISCVAHKTTTSVQSSKYSEDLSVVRPKVELPAADTSALQQNSNARKQTVYVEPTHAINKQLDGILDSISSINLTQKYIDGFTIQLYAGAKREEALSIKKQLATSMPEIESEVQYVQPNFRVKAGKYLQRIDAQKDFMAVKRHFPNAILIPDKIAIN